MVRIYMSKQSLAQLRVMPLYTLLTLRYVGQMCGADAWCVTLESFELLVLACSIIHCWKHPLRCFHTTA